MVSLVNLTGVWWLLRGVKGKANFSSILSQKVQTQTSAVFHAEKRPSDTKEIWGEQPVKLVFCLLQYLFKNVFILWNSSVKKLCNTRGLHHINSVHFITVEAITYWSLVTWWERSSRLSTDRDPDLDPAESFMVVVWDSVTAMIMQSTHWLKRDRSIWGI